MSLDKFLDEIIIMKNNFLGNPKKTLKIFLDKLLSEILKMYWTRILKEVLQKSMEESLDEHLENIELS